MKLKFSKMHGLGNDFIVIDGVRQTVTLSPERIRQLGDRHFGIGFDQMLLVEAPSDQDNDFRYRIFNNDGSEVEQCGNGARCVGRFLMESGHTGGRAEFTLETLGGELVADVHDIHNVRVNMGVPVLEPARIPFEARQREVSYKLDVNGKNYEIGWLS